MINYSSGIYNPWKAPIPQSARTRFGEPSWVAALRYRVYKLFHRHYYDAYMRRYDR